jgi:hypothetical protein
MASERTNLDKALALKSERDFKTDLQTDRFDNDTAQQVNRQDFASTAGSSEQYENLETGEIVNTIQLRNGTQWMVDENNEPTMAFNPRGHIPYAPGVKGSAGTSAMNKLREAQELDDVSVGVFANSLEFLSEQTADVLQGSTGLLDYERAVGKYGLAGEDSPFYNRIQETNNVINALTFESAGPLLDKLGIASDTDVRIAFNAAGGDNANINTIVGSYKRNVIPTIIGKARARGQMPADQIDKLEKQLYSYVSKMETTLIGSKNDKYQQNPQEKSRARTAEIDDELARLRAM